MNIRNTIAQKASFSFFLNLFQHGLGYVSLFFVARYMGAEALGIVAFAFAYVEMFHSFSDLGFGTAHIKRVSEGMDFGKCNGTYLTVKGVLTLVMAILVLSSVLISKSIQNNAFISREHEFVLYIILIVIITGDISIVFKTSFAARREIAKQQIPLLLAKVFEVAIKIAVAVLGLGVIMLAGASLISVIVSLLCFLYLFRNYPIKRPSKEYFKSYASFALPVMFIGFLSKIAQNMDKVMIQFFWSATDVGYYSAAQRISGILAFITSASVVLIFPTISSYYSKGNLEGIIKLSRECERYLSMIFWFSVAFIFVFSGPICNILLGNKFTPSEPILVLLAFVALVNGLTQPYAQQISGTNHVKLAAIISAIVFIMNILLNFVFIPRHIMGVPLLGMGGSGAAVATIISITAGTFFYRYYAYKITGTKPNPRIIFHFLAALCTGAILNQVAFYIQEISFIHLMFFGIMGIAVYAAILTIFREFTRADIVLFLNILNPARMKAYAVDEIDSGYTEMK